MGRIAPSIRFNVSLSVLIVALASPNRMAAQEPELPTLRGNITAVQPPDGFDVAGYHVTTSPTTQFFQIHGPKAAASDVHKEIIVGAYVQVIGDKDRRTHTAVARQVKIKEEDRVLLSGIGVIDRMITPGPQPVFRADGYIIKLDADTQVHLSGGLKSIDNIYPGDWVHYEGRRDESGQVVAARLEFVRPKPHKPRRDSDRLAQVTSFPPGSLIDFDGTFTTKRAGHAEDAEGGDCGWYPVPDVPSVQENVRRIGMRLVPKYQRDLPPDSPERIPFRFYVVEEKKVRSGISCHPGLVLIPVTVINRVSNEDQLAAVLADGMAASLGRQQARISNISMKGVAEMAALGAIDAAGGYGAAIVGGEIVRRQIAQKMEEQRGRIALGLMADAGYDPWQAPEAWRLLNPNEPPNNPAMLKYPDRAGYQLEILGLQYKRPTDSAQSAAQAGNPATTSN
jgi:hypothetical protein